VAECGGDRAERHGAAGAGLPRAGPSRVPDQQAMEEVTTARADGRNDSEATVDWQFTTDDARIKLKRLYPKVEN